METYIKRKPYGDRSWGATTAEEFDLNGRTAQLKITTYKNSGGDLVTYADIGFITGSGCTTHMLCQDYSARLARTGARCTEKAVSQQQAQFVANWALVKQNAINFYEGK